MIKTLVSPIFILLVFMILLIIISGKKSSGYHRRDTGGWKFLLVPVLLLWIISTPIFVDFTAEIWEKPYSSPEMIKPGETEVEAVTVLSGGIYKGFYPEQDLPGDGTIHRTYRGTKYFLKTVKADHLVFQGRMSGENPEAGVKLMRDQAKNMGVDPEKILMEAKSRNTREHPLELLNKSQIKAETPIAIVTSAWHMRRSEREFSLYFEDVTPVPAEFISGDLPGGLKNYLPRASSLRKNTRLFHEIIGCLWYRFLHFVD